MNETINFQNSCGDFQRDGSHGHLRLDQKNRPHGTRYLQETLYFCRNIPTIATYTSTNIFKSL
jgi:hypothetical protein